jgi:hypothetical protein
LNVDYTLQTSPALARKLAFLRTLLRVNIDDALLRLAGEGLLAHEQVEYQLPGGLRQYLNEKTLDIIQHSVDYDDRFVLGVKTFPQAAAYSLMAAFNTGKKILVVGSLDQKLSDLWRSFFKHHDIEYQHLIDDKRVPDLTKQVLLVEPRQMKHELMSKSRDRVLVYVQSAKAKLGGDSLVYKILGDEFEFSQNSGIQDIVFEYPKSILSFCFDEDSCWWMSPQVRDLIKALHPDLHIEQIMSKHQSHQANLLQMGFILSSPQHIGRLLGLHVRTLQDKEEQTT